MATVIKDLGAVTAYAYAVEGGYTGTEEEFAALLGNIADDLSQIENLSVTVTTLPAGSSATASYSNGVLALGIPKGDKGDKGDTGATPAFTIGTVTTLAAGNDASASITGTASAPVLNLGIPKGADGDVSSASMATAYSTSATYAVGDYVWYSGQLYCCTTAISTAESWTAAHWTAVKLAEDVGNLKSALIDDRLTNYTFTDNYYIDSNTYEPASSSSYSYATIDVSPYKNLHIRTHAYRSAGICFFDADGNGIGFIYPTGTESTYLFDELVTLPDGTATAKITCLKAQKSDFSVWTTPKELYEGLAKAVDSKTPSADYNKTKTAFDDLCANGETPLTPIDWELGTLNDETGAPIASYKYIRTADYIEVGYKKIIILNPDAGYRIMPLWFDSNYSLITPASYKVHFTDRTELFLPDNVAYIKFQICKTDVSVITVDEASHVTITYKTTLQRDIALAVGDDELPDYYKANDYIYNKINRINELYNLYAADGTSFVFVTDEHYEHPRFNAQNSPKLINYIYRHTNIETLVDGGDMSDGVSSLWCEQLKQSWGGRIYHVIGNHDYMYATQAREQELYAICDAVNRDQIGVNNRHYYYVDNPQEKIRFIVLSTYAPSGSTSSAVANDGYESDQLTWFSNTALNVESGWGIIVFVHGLYEWNAGESGMGEGYYLGHGEGGQEVVSILENYSGNGEIISIVTGHTHLDRVVYTQNANICCINTTCDANTVTRYVTADPRTSGTTGEQAIDVYILDRPNRTWHIVRIGTPAYDGIGANPGNPVEERTVEY